MKKVPNKIDHILRGIKGGIMERLELLKNTFKKLNIPYEIENDVITIKTNDDFPYASNYQILFTFRDDEIMIDAFCIEEEIKKGDI